jgi:uncharacterized protein (TIGR03067 family)
MRTATLVVLLVTLFGCGKESRPSDSATPPTKPPLSIQDEMKRLEGQWKVVSVDGGFVTKQHLVTFKDDQVTFEGEQPSWRFKIDPDKDPKWIDLIGASEKPELVLPGIYKFDGDKLTFYAVTKAPSNKKTLERPKGFDPPPPGELILHLERVRK